MAKEDVEVKMSADTADMLRGWAALSGAIDKSTRKLEEFGQRGKKGTVDADNALVGLAARYVSFGMVLAGINRQLEFNAELHRKALQAQQTVASPQRSFALNLVGLPEADKAAAHARIGRISAATGAPRDAVYTAASQAFSSKGAGTVENALDALELAAKFRPDDVGEMTGLAQGIGDVSSLTGTFDPATNLGVLLSTLASSRQVSLQAISRNVVPAAIGVAQQGDSAVEALALPTALGKAMKDVEGAHSATAALALAEQLGPMEGDTHAAIMALQQDPAAAAAFLAKASFEKKASPFVRALLTDPNSETAQLYAENLRNIAQPDRAAALVPGELASIEGLAGQQAADIERQLSTVLEGDLLDNIEAGTKASLRKAAGQVAERLPDKSFFSAWVAEREFDIRNAIEGDPIAAMRVQMETARTTLRNSVAGAPFFPEVSAKDAKKPLELLNGILEVLERMENRKLIIEDPATGAQVPVRPAAAALQ